MTQGDPNANPGYILRRVKILQELCYEGEKMNQVEIYTDGACSGNPGKGGWGAIVIDDNGDTTKISGFAPYTTNNRMEMCAVISALKTLKHPSKVNLYSDSAYIVNTINQNWIKKWQQNHWYTSSKKPVQNKDLWEELSALLKYHDVKFVKVKGHSDIELNNECDFLARQAITEGGVKCL